MQLPGVVSIVHPSLENACIAKHLEDDMIGKSFSRKGLDLLHDNPKCKMTKEECMRLGEITSKLFKKNNKKEKFAPYFSANKKLKRDIRNKRFLKNQDKIRSKQLEFLLKSEFEV